MSKSISSRLGFWIAPSGKGDDLYDLTVFLDRRFACVSFSGVTMAEIKAAAAAIWGKADCHVEPHD